MKNISKTLVSLVLIGVATASLLAQSTKMGKDFLIDVNRPFVYVKFDHIGPREDQRVLMKSGESTSPLLFTFFATFCRVSRDIFGTGPDLRVRPI